LLRLGRSSDRRKTAWVDLVTEPTSVSTAAGVLRTVVLFLPATDADGATLVRIVGSYMMMIQADQATTFKAAYAGIYFATVGSVSSATMDPSSTIDRDSEDWMWHQTTYHNRASGTADVDFWPFSQVDIKVARKVAEGSAITLGFNCEVAYRSVVNLKGLLLLT